MHYWLYDEGGWPSGQATGRVVGVRPDLTVQLMRYTENGKWSWVRQPGRPDLLNPEATATFISLTHDRYRDVVGVHFGKTIHFVFTDEPAFPYVVDGREIPWTTNGSELFRRRFGYRLEDSFPAFRRASPQEYTAREKQVRIDGFDFWSARFREAYFEPLRRWSRSHGLYARWALGRRG